MAEPKNLTYLAAQERVSRELACESGDVAVRTAHVAMADGYAEQIRVIKLASTT